MSGGAVTWIALYLALCATGIVLLCRRCYRVLLWVAIGFLVIAGLMILGGFAADAAGPVALGAWYLWLWWRKGRGKRKRAARLLGAKARALRERLVRSMPQWSPRLQPQGARA